MIKIIHKTFELIWKIIFLYPRRRGNLIVAVIVTLGHDLRGGHIELKLENADIENIHT